MQIVAGAEEKGKAPAALPRAAAIDLLCQLPLAQRLPYFLVARCGFRYVEAAQVLDLDPVTLARLKHEADEALRGILWPDETPAVTVVSTREGRDGWRQRRFEWGAFRPAVEFALTWAVLFAAVVLVLIGVDGWGR